MTAVGELYARDGRLIAGAQKLRYFPLSVVGGHGSWLVEAGGREVLDLSATWTASGLGHGHPAITAALQRVSASPAGASILSAVHPAALDLAERLLELTPGPADRRVYLGHSGSDANETAIRCARAASGRRVVVAFEHGYHGGFGAAMAASGVHLDAGSVAATNDVRLVPYPDPYRAPDGYPAALAALDGALAPGDVACLLVEPIQSDGGLVVPPPGFLAELATRCRATGVLLLCDEVKVGLGRTGVLHAFARDGVTPDLITFGKALGGGLPLSATVGPAAVLDGPPASALLTTAGNPWCAATGSAVLDVIVGEDLPAAAERAGQRLRVGLLQATAGVDAVGQVRGHGLMIGVDLVDDPVGVGRDTALAAAVAYRAWELGAVVYVVAGNVLEVTPPLVITDDEVDRGVEILAQAIRDAVAGRVDPDAVAQFAGW